MAPPPSDVQPVSAVARLSCELCQGNSWADERICLLGASEKSAPRIASRVLANTSALNDDIDLEEELEAALSCIRWM